MDTMHTVGDQCVPELCLFKQHVGAPGRYARRVTARLSSGKLCVKSFKHSKRVVLYRVDNHRQVVDVDFSNARNMNGLPRPVGLLNNHRPPLN